MATMSTPACSFCRKRQDEVLQFVAVQPAYICDECAMLAVEMISIEHPDWRERLMEHWRCCPRDRAKRAEPSGCPTGEAPASSRSISRS
jgi:hypothetical protein